MRSYVLSFARYWTSVILITLIIGQLVPEAKATPFINVNVATQEMILNPGSTGTVTGTITNDSSTDLNETDFFFNFFGFNLAALTLTQILGVNSDSSISAGTTSSVLDLFTVNLGTNALQGSVYSYYLTLEDSAGDVSPTVRASVSPSTSVNVTPEPRFLGLFGILILLCFGFFCVSRQHSSKRGKTTAVVFLWTIVLCANTFAFAQQGPSFTTSIGGIAQDTHGNVLISITINNIGSQPITGLEISSVSMGSLIITSPVSYPVVLGPVSPGSTAHLSVTGLSAGVTASTRVLLSVRGSYVFNGQTLGLDLNRFITIPPAGTVNGSVFTIYTNPTDEHLLQVQNTAGTVFDYFGTRDQSGVPLTLTGLSVTPKGAGTTLYLLDTNNELVEVDDSAHGVTIKLTWSSAIAAVARVYQDGSLLTTLNLAVPSAAASVIKPLTSFRIKTSAIPNVLPVPATSYNAFGHVTECNGAPGMDATVYFQYGTALALQNVPGTQISPGIYAGGIPSPNQTAAATLQELCNDTGEAVGNVCDWVVEPLSTLISLLQSTGNLILEAVATALEYAEGACDVLGGGSAVPKGPDNLIQYACQAIPAINQGLNGVNTIQGIATVQGSTLNGGTVTTLPANFSFVFPNANCNGDAIINLTSQTSGQTLYSFSQTLSGTVQSGQLLVTTLIAVIGSAQFSTSVGLDGSFSIPIMLTEGANNIQFITEGHLADGTLVATSNNYSNQAFTLNAVVLEPLNGQWDGTVIATDDGGTESFPISALFSASGNTVSATIVLTIPGDVPTLNTMAYSMTPTTFSMTNTERSGAVTTTTASGTISAGSGQVLISGSGTSDDPANPSSGFGSITLSNNLVISGAATVTEPDGVDMGTGTLTISSDGRTISGSTNLKSGGTASWTLTKQ